MKIVGIISGALVVLVAGVIMTVSLLFQPPSAAACGILTGPNQAGNAPPNASLFEAIKVVSNGNSRLALSLLMGSHIESGWSNTASGGGAFGPYQIQHPGVVHPDITIAQAQDPAYATNYMLPAYTKALASVSDSLWRLNPVMAAELTIYRAERPAVTYHVNRGYSAVNASYDAAMAVLVNQLGMKGGLSGSVVLASADITTSPPSPTVTPVAATTGCATSLPGTPGSVNDPGPGPQDANASGVFFNLRPRTTKLVKFAQANYDCGVIKPPGCIHGYGGWRPYDPVPDHPDGRATDFTISTQIGSLPNPAELQFGWSLACSLQTHASEFGIQYMIWQGQIFNVARSDEGGPGGCGGVTRGWRDYCSGGSCGPYGNTTSPTQLHLDHVHVTLKP